MPDRRSPGAVGAAAGDDLYVFRRRVLLLDLIVEQVTRRSYESVARDQLLTPLGIVGMRLAGQNDLQDSEVFHWSKPNRIYMDVLGAAGSWLAASSDVVKVVDSLDPAEPGFHPLSAATTDAMRAPEPFRFFRDRWYGLGLVCFVDGTWGHTGTLESAHARSSASDPTVPGLALGTRVWSSGVMRHAPSRVSGIVGVVAILAVGATACRVPSPLTYPLLLAPPVDATTEVQQLLGASPPPGQGPTEIARQLATALTGQRDGCEVLTVAQVVWVAPTAPATAAIEVRGLCDDAVAGLWYEITIAGSGPGGWITATKQDVCARGVSGPVCV